MERYGPMVGEAEIAECGRLLSLAFAGPRERSEEWVRLGGVENMRVLREGGREGGRDGDRVVACLMRIPMGQYFGGKSVPMVGIAGVAVAPEDRGRGHARVLMQECVRECAAEGSPITTLYASTQELYRQVGYEQAGHRFTTIVPYTQLEVDRRDAAEDRGVEMRVAAATAADEEEIRACYAEFARTRDGMLDRGAYVWRRTRQMRDVMYAGWVVRVKGKVEGYVFVSQERDTKTGRHDLSVSDYAFTTARAGRRIVQFLGNFGSMMQECVLPGGPLHPLAHFMAQQRFKVEKKDFWMVRVTDVARALEGRGYPAGVNATLVVDVRDDLVPMNNGRFELTVRDGAASVTRLASGGSKVGLSVSVRGLAALYCGVVTAQQAVGLGWVSGSIESIGLAAALFAGGTPAMTDHF